jgi:5-methylcytosine-specific restriction endonuclease McrA
MQLSILKKVDSHNNMGNESKPTVPPPGTSRDDWFKWYSEVYLVSPHWLNLRESILKRDQYRCRTCNCSGTRTNPLHAHHNCYDDLWNENEINLVTLCNRCHKAIHKAIK